MSKQWTRIGVVVVAVALFGTSAWCQERRGPRGFMGAGQQGQYISAVLLLDKETSAKVDAVYEEEGRKSMEAMRGIFESAGDDREAAREKMMAEREKSAERTKAALKKILSEEQLKSIEPLMGASFGFRGFGRDPFLFALPALSLSSTQRAQLLKVTVPYAQEMQPLTSRSRDEGEDERAARQEKAEKRMAAFKKDAGAVLNADQRTKWEEEAAKLQKEWEEQREQFRQQRQQRQ